MAWKSTNNPVMQDLSGFFKKGEKRDIYNSCQKDRDKLLIRLLWKSGRRVGEILMLKVKDIDFDNCDIIWNIEKKKKPLKKVKPMDKFTIALLDSYIDNENLLNDDYVFRSAYKPEFPITRQRAFQIVREACERIGINFVGDKRPHPHHFRHSFAVNWAKTAKSPADLRKLQQYLEHSSLDMTEQYLDFAAEDARDIINQEDS